MILDHVINITRDMEQVKAMVNTMYNNRSFYNVGLTSNYQGIAASVSKQDKDISDSLMAIFEQPEKVEEIASIAISKRSDRVGNTKKKIVQQYKMDGKEQVKSLILATGVNWLKLQDDVVPGESELEDDERLSILFKDAEFRYSSTYRLMTAICEARLFNMPSTHRWAKMSGQEQENLIYVSEYIIRKTLPNRGHFPLHVAEDNWISSYLFGLIIRNIGRQKDAEEKRALAAAQQMLVAQAASAVRSPMTFEGFSIDVLEQEAASSQQQVGSSEEEVVDSFHASGPSVGRSRRHSSPGTEEAAVANNSNKRVRGGARGRGSTRGTRGAGRKSKGKGKQ
ncbi:hypothetical protein BD408DRAFT_415913 [Parasitella parasitica]|nr:hypothetical protein BD408DRAFT_415913 [Parasitella parasitica]